MGFALKYNVTEMMCNNNHDDSKSCGHLDLGSSQGGQRTISTNHWLIDNGIFNASQLFFQVKKSKQIIYNDFSLAIKSWRTMLIKIQFDPTF